MLKKEFIEFLGAELADIKYTLTLQRTLSEVLSCIKDEGDKNYFKSKVDSFQDDLLQNLLMKLDDIAYLLLNCDNEEVLSQSTYFELLTRSVNE
ncbi:MULTISPECIES: hypothetical protein [unclassified Facklamia]|uniref:hypothetical protein n=1 Tax=Aerococcaceae TaxID=186827 RepID=UPI0013BD25BF|nr:MULTISPECIES: hypothetical protein [unclassified Facklamia]NEW64024.1 hypothetical protein [Facklamia sp. 252]NEW68815.1 hypothetical protein [Facklamia sp. 253]QQD65369.1 hypothetical protein JDW14_08740 [Aerococcaceae bacterium zg-252]